MKQCKSIKLKSFFILNFIKLYVTNLSSNYKREFIQLSSNYKRNYKREFVQLDL